jgi:hypothetical protein
MQRRCKHAFPKNREAVFSAWSVQSSYKEDFSWEEDSRVSRRQAAGIWAWEENNGKKWIRLWKEDFVCELKWQWDSYKSAARIRLVKTENPIVCVTENFKACRSAIALCAVYKVSMKPIIQSRICLISHKRNLLHVTIFLLLRHNFPLWTPDSMFSLFYGLFYEAISKLDYIALNGRIIAEYWTWT